MYWKNQGLLMLVFMLLTGVKRWHSDDERTRSVVEWNRMVNTLIRNDRKFITSRIPKKVNSYAIRKILGGICVQKDFINYKKTCIEEKVE